MGFEVFCHPGVTVELQTTPVSAKLADSSPTDRLREYDRILIPELCFSNSRREICRMKSPNAKTLLCENAEEIERQRNDFLSRARFDDDWLFLKFNVESPQ